MALFAEPFGRYLWARRLHLPEEEARAFLNEGVACSLSGEFESAILLYTKAHDLFRNLGSGEALIASANIAEVLAARDDSAAIPSLEAVRREAEGCGNAPLAAWAGTAIGKMLFARGDFEGGREACREAVALSERFNAPDLASESRELLENQGV